MMLFVYKLLQHGFELLSVNNSAKGSSLAQFYWSSILCSMGFYWMDGEIEALLKALHRENAGHEVMISTFRDS